MGENLYPSRHMLRSSKRPQTMYSLCTQRSWTKHVSSQCTCCVWNIYPAKKLYDQITVSIISDLVQLQHTFKCNAINSTFIALMSLFITLGLHGKTGSVLMFNMHPNQWKSSRCVLCLLLEMSSWTWCSWIIYKKVWSSTACLTCLGIN